MMGTEDWSLKVDYVKSSKNGNSEKSERWLRALTIGGMPTETTLVEESNHEDDIGDDAGVRGLSDVGDGRAGAGDGN
jgi:hypothetical protein